MSALNNALIKRKGCQSRKRGNCSFSMRRWLSTFPASARRPGQGDKKVSGGEEKGSGVFLGSSTIRETVL